ncbi:hypothetical protein C923_02267 [Plasmodium falciparum UGT5.1]|uniref:Uncharacterized protein n=2 Tax=Plasmodium falciparum TaxID=5833 RepID=W7JDV9_PLAFA|nr:hypothetical protein PFNF135_02275 [Plasmodium falciparum NF135/5.C10]EWC77070.1 hypothetical protein C923_02267 [Plasmodium falciparum UGT5.1]
MYGIYIKVLNIIKICLFYLLNSVLICFFVAINKIVLMISNFAPMGTMFRFHKNKNNMIITFL